MLVAPVAAVFSPNLKAVVDPVSAQFHICGLIVLLMVLLAVAAVIVCNGGEPPAPPHAPPESCRTVEEDHCAQCPTVMAPVGVKMPAPASVLAPVPPLAIAKIPDTELEFPSGKAPNAGSADAPAERSG